MQVSGRERSALEVFSINYIIYNYYFNEISLPGCISKIEAAVRIPLLSPPIFIAETPLFVMIHRPRPHRFHTHFASHRTRGSTRNGEIPRRGIWRRGARGGGRALSERASFACGIKIRVPRYTVVLRSQTQPSFHVRTRRGARLSASRNPFFRPCPPNVTHACIWYGRG